jgi:AcrR family transcriptional regulator
VTAEAATPTRPALRRDTIVATARQMIVADGVEALSLRGLARRLGVTAPALYSHVDNKEAVIRAVAEIEIGRLAGDFDAVQDADPVERIRAQSRAYVTYARENPELFSLILLAPPDLDVASLPPDAPLETTTQAFAAASSAVDDAIAAGAIASDNPLLVALTLWSAAHGVATVLRLGLGLPPELEDAMTDEITDRILAGYAP